MKIFSIFVLVLSILNSPISCLAGTKLQYATPDDLPDGIIMLNLSGADNIPLCERMAFIQNKDEVKVKVETEKTKYSQSDSVSVKISTFNLQPNGKIKGVKYKPLSEFLIYL